MNPTAGTALDCGFFAGGVFKPECWCLSAPALCPAADYQAAYALAHPEVYAPVQAPPVVQPAQPGQTPSDVVAQEMAAWQAQNQSTINQTAQNLQDVAANQPTLSGMVIPSWVWWLVGGVGAFVLLKGSR